MDNGAGERQCVVGDYITQAAAAAFSSCWQLWVPLVMPPFRGDPPGARFPFLDIDMQVPSLAELNQQFPLSSDAGNLPGSFDYHPSTRLRRMR